MRVLRGGAWDNHAANARSAYRNHDQRDNRWHNNGFRLALSSAAPWVCCLAAARVGRQPASGRCGTTRLGTRRGVRPKVAGGVPWQTARAPGCW